MKVVPLSVLTAPAKILSTPAEPVELSEPNLSRIEQLAARMYVTMLQSKGIGLAAPQVDISKRIFVMDTGEPMLCVNPEILDTSAATISSQEGCLSLPDYLLEVERHVWVEARWYDHNAKCKTRRLRGISAICFQHELDHLNGILLTDK